MTGGRLEGSRTLVTGAASGIGLATAARFAAEDAAVGLLDRDADRLDAVVRELEARGGGRVLALPTDVTVEEQVAASVDRLVGEFGGLDVAVANAGIQLFGQDARATELDLSVWRRTIDVNLTGAFLTCKHALRAMLPGGSGSLILTGSPTGVVGGAPGFDAYSASKAGVHGLMRVLAADYARDGIRVNAVIPGCTVTPLVDDLMADPAALETIVRSIPLGRQGTAEEVASMMVFLASDESRYATGAFFTVDGGMTAV